MKLAVYALTDAARVPSVTGTTGERLRLHREGSIAAVAGEVRRTPDASPENLRRYDGTMRRLAASMPALLPVRFGTSFNDAEELHVILRSRQDSLRRALGRVRNRVQMTVRVLGGPIQSGSHGAAGGSSTDSLHTASMASSEGRDVRVVDGDRRPSVGPVVRRSASGTRYLRERADAAARERDIPGFEPVREALRRWVRDERVEWRGRSVSVYHLVPRASAATYERAAVRAAARAGLRIVVTGPWPAYAFADTWA